MSSALPIDLAPHPNPANKCVFPANMARVEYWTSTLLPIILIELPSPGMIDLQKDSFEEHYPSCLTCKDNSLGTQLKPLILQVFLEG
jgi:hypothetical protein